MYYFDSGICIFGRYLVKVIRGIDENAKTPAYEKEDGVDFVPSHKWEVFAHQFSSIAGAGPVTGPVMAMVFGWLPAFLWIVIGGIFFGAVQDFGALYASVKSRGKSIGQIIEAYIGKTGKKLFFLFCWLFTLLVIAAFADMVAGTFNGFGQMETLCNLMEQHLQFQYFMYLLLSYLVYSCVKQRLVVGNKRLLELF